MATVDLEQVVWIPAADDAGGEPYGLLVERVREVCGDVRGTLLADVVAAGYRGLCEMAEAARGLQGGAIIRLYQGRAIYGYPQGTLGLSVGAPPLVAGRPVAVVQTEALPTGYDWPAQTGPITYVIHEGPERLRLQPVPLTDATPYVYDDATGEISLGGTVIWSGGQVESVSGTTATLSAGTPGLLDQAGAYVPATGHLRLWTDCYPSRAAWGDTSRLPRRWARALEEYLVWQMLRYGEDPEDLERAHGAEARWDQAVRDLAGRTLMRRAAPGGAYSLRAL